MDTKDYTSVSVIIPYVNEWPMIAFTIRAIVEELEGFCDYEIIAVSNYCREVAGQGRLPDRSHHHYIRKADKKNLGFYDVEVSDKVAFNQSHIEAISKQHPRLMYLSYEEKLSNWNCKNLAVKKSKGDVLLFVDSHVMPSKGLLRGALTCFEDMRRTGVMDNDTLHFPLSYNILEQKQLLYRLVYEPEKGNVHYSFLSTFPKLTELMEVPCMSSCGIMMRRSYYDKIGGWPSRLGIYGGGENYMNFVSAIVGGRKFIYPNGTLHHHGDKRGYHFNWEDYHRNRMTAIHLFADMNWVDLYQKSIGGNAVTKRLAHEAVKGSLEHKKLIDSIKVMEIEEWADKWKGIRMIGHKSGKVVNG